MRTVWRWASVVAAIVAIGCSRPADSGKKYKIAVIPKGTTHEFWKSVHAGAEKAAAELGTVEIVWDGPGQESDRERQIDIVQNFVTRKVSGICLAPLDSQALGPAVNDAKKRGIPTVIFDSGLNDASALVSYVATDNYNGGVLAARRLVEAMGGQGKIVMMKYNPGSESTEQRENGFLETLAKEFPQVTVLSGDEYPAATTPEAALDKAQTLLQLYRDQVTGVFAVCEPHSTGMLSALEGGGLAGKVQFVAFDPSPRLVEAMQAKKICGIVLQDPVNMGYLAVKAVVDHLEGKSVSSRISTGEAVATPDNMHEPRMHELLHPAQFGE